MVEGQTSTYYYSCECGQAGTETFHVHVFDQAVQQEQYRDGATKYFYYSCTCGEKGTEKFEGDMDNNGGDIDNW